MTKGKIIFFSVLGVLVVVGGYFGVKQMLKIIDAKKAKAVKDALASQPKYQQTAAQAAATASDTQSYVAKCPPYKQGCSGDAIKALQSGLIDVYGNTGVNAILPKYGADGNWGAETQAALVKNGWDTSYASFDDIIKQIAALDSASGTVIAATTLGVGSDNAVYSGNYGVSDNANFQTINT